MHVVCNLYMQCIRYVCLFVVYFYTKKLKLFSSVIYPTSVVIQTSRIIAMWIKIVFYFVKINLQRWGSTVQGRENATFESVERTWQWNWAAEQAVRHDMLLTFQLINQSIIYLSSADWCSWLMIWGFNVLCLFATIIQLTCVFMYFTNFCNAFPVRCQVGRA